MVEVEQADREVGLGAAARLEALEVELGLEAVDDGGVDGAVAAEGRVLVADDVGEGGLFVCFPLGGCGGGCLFVGVMYEPCVVIKGEGRGAGAGRRPRPPSPVQSPFGLHIGRTELRPSFLRLDRL